MVTASELVILEDSSGVMTSPLGGTAALSSPLDGGDSGGLGNPNLTE